MWLATYEAGNFVLGMEANQDVDLEGPAQGLWYVLTSPSVMWTDVWSTLMPLIGPMLVGALLLGGPIAGIIYLVVRVAVGAYQRRRHDRIVRPQIEA
jgi:uncharacterized protein (DUF2062 family)